MPSYFLFLFIVLIYFLTLVQFGNSKSILDLLKSFTSFISYFFLYWSSTFVNQQNCQFSFSAKSCPDLKLVIAISLLLQICIMSFISSISRIYFTNGCRALIMNVWLYEIKLVTSNIHKKLSGSVVSALRPGFVFQCRDRVKGKTLLP